MTGMIAELTGAEGLFIGGSIGFLFGLLGAGVLLFLLFRFRTGGKTILPREIFPKPAIQRARESRALRVRGPFGAAYVEAELVSVHGPVMKFREAIPNGRYGTATLSDIHPADKARAAMLYAEKRATGGEWTFNPFSDDNGGKPPV